jgi:hypothetical protein
VPYNFRDKEKTKKKRREDEEEEKTKKKRRRRRREDEEEEKTKKKRRRRRREEKTGPVWSLATHRWAVRDPRLGRPRPRNFFIGPSSRSGSVSPAIRR